jgi:hypothetical protein
MSPLVETIEVSETIMREGETRMYESEITATPSEWHNGKSVPSRNLSIVS